MKFCFLFFLTVFFVFGATAQTGIFSRKSLANQYATVGLGGGSTHYFGDLSPYSSPQIALYKNVRWNGTANYTRHINNQWAARVAVSYIRLFGNDETYALTNMQKFAFRYLRNLHFRNDVKEIALTGVYNLLPNYGKGAGGRSKFMPYTSFGLAFFGHNPKAKGSYQSVLYPTVNNDQWYSLRPLNTEGQGIPGNNLKSYSYVSAAIPLGLGVRLKINENIDINLEGILRLTYFDYLDDVGNNSFPASTLLSSNYGPESAKLSYRADEKFNALTLKDRTANFVKAAIFMGSSNTGITPENNAASEYPYSQKRGSGQKDAYFTTQITLNYVIGKNIKCPPIR